MASGFWEDMSFDEDDAAGDSAFAALKGLEVEAAPAKVGRCNLTLARKHPFQSVFLKRIVKKDNYGALNLNPLVSELAPIRRGTRGCGRRGHLLRQ